MLKKSDGKSRCCIRLMYESRYPELCGSLQRRIANIPARAYNDIGAEFLHQPFRLYGSGKIIPCRRDVFRIERALKSPRLDVVDRVAFLSDKKIFHSLLRADESYIGIGKIVFYYIGDRKGGIYVTTRASARKQKSHILKPSFRIWWEVLHLSFFLGGKS